MIYYYAIRISSALSGPNLNLRHVSVVGEVCETAMTVPANPPLQENLTFCSNKPSLFRVRPPTCIIRMLLYAIFKGPVVDDSELSISIRQHLVLSLKILAGSVLRYTTVTSTSILELLPNVSSVFCEPLLSAPNSASSLVVRSLPLSEKSLAKA